MMNIRREKILWFALPYVAIVLCVFVWLYIGHRQSVACERAGGHLEQSWTSRLGWECVREDGVVIHP